MLLPLSLCGGVHQRGERVLPSEQEFLVLSSGAPPMRVCWGARADTPQRCVRLFGVIHCFLVFLLVLWNTRATLGVEPQVVVGTHVLSHLPFGVRARGCLGIPEGMHPLPATNTSQNHIEQATALRSPFQGDPWSARKRNHSDRRPLLFKRFEKGCVKVNLVYTL